MEINLGGLIGTATTEKDGLMPAGMLVREQGTVYVNAGDSYEIGVVNGFLMVCDNYSWGGFLLFWCSYSSVIDITNAPYDIPLELYFNESRKLILKNISQNKRGYQIYRQILN